MQPSEKEKIFRFKKKIKEIKSYRGEGTTLISLYIPAGYPIPEVASKVREEISQAQNIKSKQTRTNVISALERILTVLKEFKKTPDNGLVIFCGNVGTENKEDFKTFVLEPIHKLNMSVYRCDSSFYTEPLEKMVENQDAYGILVMDGREATFGLLKGTELIKLRDVHSTAHAKVRKGGQSARRYERLIEEATRNYYKRVGETMDELFLGKVKGVIVGGPGPTKEYFLEEKPFNYQHKILGVVDTGYTGFQGLREVVAKAEDILKEQEAIKEARLVNRFIREVVHGGKAVYGLNEVLEAIKSQRADLVLVSEKLNEKGSVYRCKVCGAKFFIREGEEPYERCPECGGELEFIEEAELFDYIIELCNDYSVPYELISTDTQEGNQFFYSFAGIGAFLRY